jgi:hypothetical protein
VKHQPGEGRESDDAGSGTLTRGCRRSASARSPIATDTQPASVCLPITIATPAIAPAAAAVAPLTKPTSRGCFS